MSFVLALDQGTTSSRAILFDRDGAVHARRAAGVPADLPAAGLGRARRHARSGRRSPASCTQSLAKARIGARDVAAIGITNQRETTVIWERATRRGRSPTPSSGRTGARRRMCDELRAAGHARDVRAQDGPRARRLLFGHQGALAARPRPRRARARRARRARLRHRRRVARLESDRRARARDRRDQREPHAACSTSTPARGTTSSCASSTSRAKPAAAGRAFVGDLRRRDLGGRRRADRGHRRRPAGGALRPGLPLARASRRTPTAPAASCC